MNGPLSSKRRRALAHGAALAGGALLVFSADVRNALAQKSSKASLNYQDHPHEGKRCADCKHFSAADDGSGAGTCALVEGPIQPSGWCVAFSPR